MFLCVAVINTKVEAELAHIIGCVIIYLHKNSYIVLLLVLPMSDHCGAAFVIYVHTYPMTGG